MAEKKLTPYEIGLKIKALLDDKAETNVILETVGIKRAQLTPYKKIIKNGRLEALKTKSVRKVLSEEKGAERTKKAKGSEPEQEIEPLAPRLHLVSKAQPPQSEVGQGPGMINEIEKKGENDNEDINLEYFVGGQKKYFVRHHNHHNISEKFSKDILWLKICY